MNGTLQAWSLDAGNLTIYAGCANDAVEEVVDLCVAELRAMKQAPVPESRKAVGAPAGGGEQGGGKGQA